MIDGSVLIAGGGTGGHLSPGIAIYEEFRKRGIGCCFLAGAPDMKFASMKDIKEDDLLLYGAPTLTRNIFKLPLFALRFTGAALKARKMMKVNDVKAVIGMGGYVSAPALIAALSMKIPVYLCEQNVVPGRVTKSFEKRARKIFSTFSETIEYLTNHGAFMTVGNPIRKRVFSDISKAEAKKLFHLSHSKKVILAIGGSQGAVKINELIYGLKKNFPDELKDTGIIWSTGDYSYEKYSTLVKEELDGGSVFLSPFIERVGEAYAAADFAVSRSGAGVMMELAAMGIPSLLIPYPFAAYDHQNKNADSFVEAGAAVKIMDSESTPENGAGVLFDILNNPRMLKDMSEAALAAAKPEAAASIVDSIVEDLSK